MALRVPVNPQTRAATKQAGYQQAAPALDFSPITGAIDGLRQQLEADQRDRQAFDINKRFVQEVNELQSDFERRKRDPAISPYTFADTTDADYRQRHEDMLNGLWEEGYDQDLIENFALRLGTVRQGFFENGLGHQLGALRSKAFAEIDEFGVGLSQYVAANPDGFGSTVEELREAIWASPDLTDQEKQAKFDEQLGIIRQGGAKGIALMNPQLVIDSFDPNGLTAPISTTPTGNAYENISGWQGVATTVASQLGLSAEDVAAVMSFETGGKLDPDLMGGDSGNYMGLIQFGPEERRTYGIDKNSTPQEWTQAILGFMADRGFTPGMGIADFYSTILTGSPGNYDRMDSNGTTVRNAIPRILADHRENAQRWLSQGVQTIDPGASTAPQAPPPTSAETPQSISDVQTGHPLLDALNGPERLQALGWAREQMNRQTASIKASIDVAINNAEASVSNGGQYAGPQFTEEQMIQAYGPLEGPLKYAQFEGALQTGQVVQRMLTLSPEEIEREVTSLTPDPASTTYAIEVAQFNAAQRAQQEVLRQRAADPAAYVLQNFPDVAAEQERGGPEYYAKLERAYERLGIPEEDRVAFPEEMLDSFGQQYERQTPEQKLATIERSIESMGDMAGRTLGAAGGSALAQDVATYAMLRRSPNFRTTFTEIMRGKAIIADDPARRPSQQYINQQFASSMATTINNLNPNISRALNEAAAAIYVQRGGRTGKGADGVDQFDEDLYEAALRTATGGTGRPNTGVVDMSTSDKVEDWTILPSGVSRTQFENWVDSLGPGDLTRLSVGQRPPVDRSGRPLSINSIIDEGVFVMLAPGKYGIKLESDGKWVADTAGQRFTIQLDLRPVR